MAAEQPKPPPTEPAAEGPAPAPENRHTRRANAVLQRKQPRQVVERKASEAEALREPDTFQQQGRTIVDWVVDHLKELSIGLGVVLALLLGWGIVDGMQSGARKDAAEALYLARKDIPAGASLDGDTSDDALAAALPALAAVATAHDGTPQADEARLEAGSIAFRLGQLDVALEHFRAAKGGGGLLASLALAGEAAVLESQDKPAEAAQALEALRARTKGDARAQATIDLARVHAAAGDKDKAKGLLVSFQEEFPDSLLLPDAQARLAALQ